VFLGRDPLYWDLEMPDGVVVALTFPGGFDVEPYAFVEVSVPVPEHLTSRGGWHRWFAGARCDLYDLACDDGTRAAVGARGRLAMLLTQWHVWQTIPSPSETGRRFWGVSAMPSTSAGTSHSWTSPMSNRSGSTVEVSGATQHNPSQLSQAVFEVIDI
jgi:hypothetical protein